MTFRPAYLLPLALMACDPVPMTPERAEAACLREVSQADGVSGSVGVGVGTGGPSARGNVTFTNRVFNPQTEEEFLAECIARRVEGRPAPTTFGVSVGRRT